MSVCVDEMDKKTGIKINEKHIYLQSAAFLIIAQVPTLLLKWLLCILYAFELL